MTAFAAHVERVWYGRSTAALAARGVLTPLSMLYGGALAARNALYVAGVLGRVDVGVPTVSVGNLSRSVAPARRQWPRGLQHGYGSAGASPAIVMRGYGADEPAVHALLNPRVPVYADADRVAAATRAVEAGADVIVLDDAFQHRRVARLADVVLVSADRTPLGRVLPAGPLREPVRGLARATTIVVTRKAVSLDAARAVAREIETMLDRRGHSDRPQPPIVQIALAFDRVHRWREGDDPNVGGDDALALAVLRGQRLLAVAAVGDPSAFFTQLAEHGATVVPTSWRDHHAFTAADVAGLVDEAAGTDLVVCTLKDAVKLGPLWPRTAQPLWYVSQRVVVEVNSASLDAELDRLLAARVAS